MATKEQLELQKKAQDQEKARLEAQKLREKFPNAAKGQPGTKSSPDAVQRPSRTGKAGFTAQDAMDVRGITPGFEQSDYVTANSEQIPVRGKVNTGVATPTPPVAENTPVTAAETAEKEGQARIGSFLTEQGVSPFVQAQDPSQFNDDPGRRRAAIRSGFSTVARTPEALQGVSDALPQGALGDAGREFLKTSEVGLPNQGEKTDFVNLGNFGTKGGPNIFGKATEAGGRINTFVGAGNADPNDPTSVVSQNDVQRVGAGIGRLTPELQAAARAFEERAASGGNLRAGDRRFRGGAAGGGNDTLRRVSAINRRADNAFNQALEAGMNTKAAARIAGSIRDGATQINFQDRTAQSGRNVEAQIQGQKDIQELRNLSAREQLSAEQAQALNDADFEDLKGLSYMTNEEGEQVFDQQSFSNALFAAGGRSNLQGLSGSAKHALFRQGSNVTKFLTNINSALAKKGKRVDNIGDLLKGASLTGDGKLAQTNTTLMQALRSDTISIGDIFGETLTLSDGTLMPLGDLLGEDAAQFTNEERAALIEIIPED